MSIENSPVNSKQLGELIDEIEKGTISNRAAKEVFEEMCVSKKSVQEIINDKGLIQISDTSEIEKFINQVLVDNPINVEKYKNGKTKILGINRTGDESFQRQSKSRSFESNRQYKLYN